MSNIHGDSGIVAEVNASKRLLVDAQLSTGGESPIFTLQPFIPKVHFDAVGEALNTSTYVVLWQVSGVAGKLDFIAAASGASTYKIKLTIDGSVVYDVAMSELSAIGLSNAPNVEMWVETADKNFRYHPNLPVDFTDSMKVEAIATAAGTQIVKHLIMYREAVV